MENKMKQILYIPSGRYFLFFDPDLYTSGEATIPILSAQELITRDTQWVIAHDIDTVEKILTAIVVSPKKFNHILYKNAGIDLDSRLTFSEFEIIEDGK